LSAINTTDIIQNKPVETFLKLFVVVGIYSLIFIIIYFLIKKIIKTNLLGLTGIIFTEMLINIGVYYLDQENQFFWINGICLLLLAVIPLLFYVLKYCPAFINRKSRLP
jgi:hypothetical protein